MFLLIMRGRRVCAAMAGLHTKDLLRGAWCDVPFEKACAVWRGLLNVWFMWPGAGQPRELQRTLVSAFLCCFGHTALCGNHTKLCRLAQTLLATAARPAAAVRGHAHNRPAHQQAS